MELSNTASFILLLLPGICIYFNKALTRTVIVYISWALNSYYSRCYAVYHTEHGRALAGCSYVWPNGQGDESKFKSGKENSETWGRQYGGIYRIWSGSTPEIILTNPDDVKVVFKDSNQHKKATNNNSGYLMSRILGQCVGLISGRPWESVRTVSEKPFLRSAIPNQISMIQSHTRRFFEKLQVEGKLKEKTIHPAEDLKLLPFWIIAEIIYGPLDADIKQRLMKLIPLRLSLFNHVLKGGLSRFSWMRFLPIRAIRELKRFRAEWHEFNNLACTRAQLQKLDALIVPLFQSVASGDITSEQLYQTVDEILYANLDVTLGALSWNLVFIGANRDIQARLLAEITEKMAGAETDDQSMHVYLMSSTTLLAACMSESSRLRPLAAFSVPQSAPTPRVVGGYHFPAGTDFVVDAYALNTNQSFWGPDACSYRPDRFFGLKGSDTRYSFWRFGFGPRQCMGKYVADTLIRAIIIHLVQNYDLGLLDTKEWGRDEDVWINHPNFRIRCEPRITTKCI